VLGCNCEGKRVLSEGSNDSPLLIITPGPNSQDIQNNQALSSRQALTLWGTLKRLGVDRADCRIIHTVCTFPQGQDGRPSQVQLDSCSNRFDADMRASNAKSILCLGYSSMVRVMGYGAKIDDVNAYVMTPKDAQPRQVRRWEEVTKYKSNKFCAECKKAGCKKCNGTGYKYKVNDPRYGWVTYGIDPVFPPKCQVIVVTWEPYTVQATGYKTQFAFTAALARAVKWSKQLYTPEILVYGEHAHVLEVGSDNLVALDIETVRGTNTITDLGIATSKGAFTAPWNYETKQVALQMLSDPNTIKIAHNMPFDAKHLENAGVPVKGKWFCTMRGATMLQPDLPKGLERVAPLYLDVPRWKHARSINEKLYNASDTINTRRLARKQEDGMRKLGYWPLFIDTIMGAYPALGRMTKRGIKVDKERMVEWMAQLDGEHDKLHLEWTAGAGAGRNYASHVQLKKLFYDDLGLSLQFNKKGKVSVDEDALRNLQKLAPPKYGEMISTLLKLRSVTKLKSTYAEVEMGESGCIHPDYLPPHKDYIDSSGQKGIPTTLRLATSDPNIQNQPLIARKLYIPHSKDMVLVAADYQQLELWIDAAQSHDANMLHDLAYDLHAGTAKRLGVSRPLAKSWNYAICKGAGDKKLIMMLREEGFNVTMADVINFSRVYAKTYPAYWEYRAWVANEVATKRQIKESFGYVRPFYGGSRDITRALGFMSQATAGCIMWDRLNYVDAVCTDFGGSLLTQVHDEFLSECPKAKINKFALALRDTLQVVFSQIGNGLSVPVSIKVGENWGEMKELTLA